MYDFDYDLGYDPAVESLGSFFSNVKDMIIQFGKRLHEVIMRIANGLKSKDKTKFNENNQKANKLVNDICNHSKELISYSRETLNAIKEFAEKYAKTGKNEPNAIGDEIFSRVEGDTVRTNASRMQRAKDVDKKEWKGEIDKLSEGKIGDGIANLSELASKSDEIRDKLHELNGLYPLSYQTTALAYKDLREIYSENSSFAKDWDMIKRYEQWATGKIQSYLKRIVSLYNLGVRITNAFSTRLVKGAFSASSDDDGATVSLAGNGKQMSKSQKKRLGEKTMRGDYDNDLEESRGSTESTSYILNRLYQVAYEDAYEDITRHQNAMAFFESVPEYEFDYE